MRDMVKPAERERYRCTLRCKQFEHMATEGLKATFYAALHRLWLQVKESDTAGTLPCRTGTASLLVAAAQCGGADSTSRSIAIKPEELLWLFEVVDVKKDEAIEGVVSAKKAINTLGPVQTVVVSRVEANPKEDSRPRARSVGCYLGGACERTHA